MDEHLPMWKLTSSGLPPLHWYQKKKRRQRHGALLDALPLEILEQIFVESANLDFVLTSRYISEQLDSTCPSLRARMLYNWVEREERVEEVVEEVPNEGVQEADMENQEMTEAQIAEDVQQHIHEPQTIHIDDMVVDAPEPAPAPAPTTTTTTTQRHTVVWTVPMDIIKYRFVTRELLESLDLRVTGVIPSDFGAPDASARRKNILPLLKKCGLVFQNFPGVLAKAAFNVDHFKFLVRLDFAPPPISSLIATLRLCQGKTLFENRSNMDLLPNWLIKSGYFADSLSSDELWRFLLGNQDKAMVNYFLQLGLVPSEGVLTQFPTW